MKLAGPPPPICISVGKTGWPNGKYWIRRKESVLRQPEVTLIFCVEKDILLRVKGGAVNNPAGTQM